MTGAVYGGTLLMVRDEERARLEAEARLRLLEERVGASIPPGRPQGDDLARAIAEARLQALTAALDVADRNHGGNDGGT